VPVRTSAFSFYGSVWLPKTNCADLPLPYRDQCAAGIKNIKCNMHAFLECKVLNSTADMDTARIRSLGFEKKCA
jgi:hypothetical protein